MIDKNQQQKIGRFLADRVMSETVYTVLLDTYLKPQKDQDVHVLAASKIAIERLQDAWKELEKYRSVSEGETKELRQVGM